MIIPRIPVSCPISVEDPAPDMAKLIADKIATVSSDYIGDIMEMVPPKLIEEGEIPIQKSSPSNVKNALIGALLGAVIVCGLITVQVVMNDTIRTEEDVTKYLDCPYWHLCQSGREKSRRTRKP